MNNNFGDLTIEDLVDFNILLLHVIQSGPVALFTGSIVIISCSSIIKLLKSLLHKLYILGSVILVSSIVEMDEKYAF